MKNRIRVLLSCMMCLTLASTGLARKHHRHVMRYPYGPAIFSNRYVDPETGDVGGMEVILVPSDTQVWATVVYASGVSYDPVLVLVKTDGANIEFTLPATERYESETYTGKISRAGLTLTGGGGWRQFLKRRCY